MKRTVKVCCPSCDTKCEIKFIVNDFPLFCPFCGEDLPQTEYEDEYDEDE